MIIYYTVYYIIYCCYNLLLIAYRWGNEKLIEIKLYVPNAFIICWIVTLRNKKYWLKNPSPKIYKW